ncbi:MAG: sigma-70 family RNA polymerase sigma factor [Candidatus Riflebacteria bacterium]|jgi:RNA polymerase sigma-70 factor (ECF subfamily)|nr:sigma-70 family RNA polymerase sigma factor [Candidatus Riflebacteria bacterium]
MQNGDNLDCNALIELAKRGQKSAFTQLVKMYYGTVMYYLLGMNIRHADAEDVAQEAFINAFRKISQVNTSGSFIGWLLRIARNQFIDKLRREKKLDTSGSTYELEEFSDHRTPEAQVVSAAEVENIFSDLKPRERVILELRVFQNLPFIEVAEILEMTEGNVRLIFHRLITRLRSRFSEKVDNNGNG